MNVTKVFAKEDFVKILKVVSSVNVLQDLMYRLIERNVQITMNVRKLVCVQMVFALTWTEAISANVKVDLHFHQQDDLVLVNKNTGRDYKVDNVK